MMQTQLQERLEAVMREASQRVAALKEAAARAEAQAQAAGQMQGQGQGQVPEEERERIRCVRL